MPPRAARVQSSPSPAEEEEDEEEQVQTKGRQTALQRRKTTAGDEHVGSSLPSSHDSKTGPRQSMPSHTNNDLLSTPRSAQSLAQIRNSGHEPSPTTKTPISLGPTVFRRFESLQETSDIVLNFYQEYAEHLKALVLELPAIMDDTLYRYWTMFDSTKKCRVLPSKDYNADFLDLTAILQGNLVEADSELAVEITSAITAANRATFVHMIAQLPFRLSPLPAPYSPWSVDKLGVYLSQDNRERWPIRDIEELMSIRREFFKKIVPPRRKVLVTLDDLNLYLDLCTQISICYLWIFSTTKNAKERQKNVESQIERVFSGQALYDAIGLVSEDQAGEENEENIMASLIEAEYTKMVDERMKRFKDLKHAPAALQQIFPFAVTAASLISYVNGLRHFHPFPLRVFDTGLAVPRNKVHIFSPAMRSYHDEMARQTEGASEEIHNEEQNRDANGEEDPPANSRPGMLRFSKDSRLERIDSAQRAPSIINRIGDVEAFRDTEFDEGDPDVFLEKETRRTATRGRGRKKAGQTRKGKEPASKPSIREGDSDEELPGVATSMSQNRQISQQSEARQEGELDEAADFEVDQEELQQAQRESEDRRGVKQKRKRAEREESEYLPPTAGPSASGQRTEASAESSTPKPKQPKQERTGYRYGTGGNQLGRVAWSETEKECLLRDLEELHPRYLESLGKNIRFAVWKEILRRHGQNGSLSTVLQNRNNVQLKDKARNEFERRKRAQETIPDWLAPYG